MHDTKLTYIQRSAGVGALVARVFALTCQSTDPVATKDYHKFFYYLGKLRIRPGHFHHAVWKLANWGGLEVEIDNACETAADEVQPFNIYSHLLKNEGKLGCGELLGWFLK